MIGFNTFSILMFSLLFIIHIDYIFYFCLTKFWYLNLQTNERTVLKKKSEFTDNQSSFFWIFLINCLLFVTKFSICNYYNLLTFFIVFLFLQISLMIIYILKHYKNLLINFKFLNLILQIIIFVFFSFAFIDNFLSLFFLLEILAVCYYFFFLSSINNKIIKNVNEFKNLLIFYLWNSFWTSILFSLFLLTLIYNFGTLNFNAVKLLWTNEYWYVAYLFFFSIFLKLGLPLFHFYKLQVYFLLDLKYIFFYSIITTFTNLCILLLISDLDIFLNFTENISIFIILLIGNLITVINAFRSWTIFNLFLYSAITTFIVFIVILF